MRTTGIYSTKESRPNSAAADRAGRLGTAVNRPLQLAAHGVRFVLRAEDERGPDKMRRSGTSSILIPVMKPGQGDP